MPQRIPSLTSRLSPRTQAREGDPDSPVVMNPFRRGVEAEYKKGM